MELRAPDTVFEANPRSTASELCALASPFQRSSPHGLLRPAQFRNYVLQGHYVTSASSHSLAAPMLNFCFLSIASRSLVLSFSHSPEGVLHHVHLFFQAFTYRPPLFLTCFSKTRRISHFETTSSSCPLPRSMSSTNLPSRPTSLACSAVDLMLEMLHLLGRARNAPIR